MKFPLVFTRSKGPGDFPALGSDPNPMSTTLSPGDVNAGNMFRTRMQGMTGLALSNLVVGYKGPVGAIPLTLEVYVWIDSISKWFLVMPATVVPPDSFEYVGVPNPLSQAPKALQDGNVVGEGDFFIRVLDPGAAPAGDHTIIVAGDQGDQS